LNWNKWVRQTHRWLSIVFTVAVIINGVTVVRGKYNNRLGLSAVLPLALLLLSGLVLVRAAVSRQVGQRATHRLNRCPGSRGVRDRVRRIASFSLSLAVEAEDIAQQAGVDDQQYR
jgi:hypothetical protein